MNKKSTSFFKRIFIILITIAIIFILFAGVYGFVIINNPDVITIGVGEIYTLTPTKSDYSIRSYHAGVVSPSGSNSVSGVSLGEGIVGIKYSYFDREFYKFRVVEAPTEMLLNKSELTLSVGESFSLSATCNSGSHAFSVTYKSSNPQVATVSEDGLIKSVSTGECEIIACAYNELKSSCKVTVKDAPTSLKFSKSEVVLGVTEQFAPKLEFNENEASNSVVYSLSDDSVLKFEDSVVTALGCGECVVTATTHNGVKAQLKVTVKELPQEVSLLVLPKYIVATDFEVLYDIPKNTAANDIAVSVSDEDVLCIDEKDPMLIHCLKKGSSTLTLKLKNGVTASKEIVVDDFKSNSIDFTALNQYPSLPTGCEVVSLTSVLRHYGCKIDATTMADKYLPKRSYDYYCVSPHDYFLGDPRSRDGFGCFSGCIVKTAENYFEDNNIDDFVAVDISGCSVDEFYSYLENDIPVITWVTSGFVDPYHSGSWTVENETIKWCNHEHCLVTTGYDKEKGRVAVADNSGGYSYTVSKEQFEKVFKGMGSMAVAVLKK